MIFTRIATASLIIGALTAAAMDALGYYPLVSVVSGIMAFYASGDWILNWIDERK